MDEDRMRFHPAHDADDMRDGGPALKHKTFTFGDRIENGWASERNPTRVGFFVRRGLRRGKLNPGPFVVMTDGRGKFWEVSAGSDNRLRLLAKTSNLLAI